jgi:hypothetical protein
MGLLTIPMALLLALGTLAGVALLLTGAGGAVASGVALIVAACAALGGLYLACEPLARVAFGQASAGRIASARVAALAFGAVPALAVSGVEIAALALLPEPGRPPSLLAAGWAYAVATGPATALAAIAGCERRTLWSVRAYAAHLSCWILLVGDAVAAPGIWRVAALAPGVLPAAIGAVIALADPAVLRTTRL